VIENILGGGGGGGGLKKKKKDIILNYLIVNTMLLLLQTSLFTISDIGNDWIPPFKVQGSTPLGCKQFLGATPPGEKPATYPDPCRETSEGAVHESRGISRGARKLAWTPKVIKKKKMIGYL
jgi:hypothetical protein